MLFFKKKNKVKTLWVDTETLNNSNNNIVCDYDITKNVYNLSSNNAFKKLRVVKQKNGVITLKETYKTCGRPKKI